MLTLSITGIIDSYTVNQPGVNYSRDHFTTVDNDGGDQTGVWNKSEMMRQWNYEVAWGKVIHKKKPEVEKYRYSVPLKGLYHKTALHALVRKACREPRYKINRVT